MSADFLQSMARSSRERVAHALRRFGMFLERAVRVVEPGHVHPRLDQLEQGLGLA